MSSIPPRLIASNDETTLPGISRFSPARIEIELQGLNRRLGLPSTVDSYAKVGRYEWNDELDRLQFCTKAFADVYDMSIEEILVAQNSWENMINQIHVDDRPRYAAATQLMVETGVLEIQYRLALPDGRIKNVREHAVSVEDESGVRTGSLGLLRDVTDEVMNRQEFDFPDEFARQSEEITDIGHFVFDEVKEVYSYVSEGFCRIHGYQADDVNNITSVADDLADIVSEDRQRVAEEYRHFIENNQEGCAIEYRIERADGSIRWIRELSQAKQVKEGRVVQTLGVIQDITDRVEREQELVFKDSIARHAEIITDIGYFLYDMSTDEHLYMSSGYARIAGFGVQELRDNIRSAEDYLTRIHPGDRDRIRDLYNAPRKDSEGWEYEYRLQRPDGETRWVREVGKVFPAQGGCRRKSGWCYPGHHQPEKHRRGVTL